MRFKCPRCQSDRIEIKNDATIVCSIVGALAGGISGALGAAGGRPMPPAEPTQAQRQ